MGSVVKQITRALIALTVIGIITLVVLSIFWSSITVYVPPRHMGVVIKKTGSPLDAHTILADKGQKGIQAVVLGEGRHFINPVTTEVEVRPCIVIPPGKLGVVKSNVGRKPAADSVLANDDENGIWRRVLTPGVHRLNPYGYTVEVCNAVVIAPGYVGMMTTRLGKETTNQFAGPGEKGIMREILQPGIYYVNPLEVKVLAVEIGINQVTFAPPTPSPYAYRTARTGANARPPQQTDNRIANAPAESQQADVNAEMLQAEERQEKAYAEKSSNWARYNKSASSTRQKIESETIMRRNEQQQIRQQGVEVKEAAKTPSGGKDAQAAAARPMPDPITFPSKDGFQISLDATIEWELLPKDVATVVAEFGDVAAVEDKIIIPQSQSIGRLQGSTFGAKDFLLGEEREKFQEVFRHTLSDVALDKNIVIHSAFIRNILLPQDLLLPIRERYIAVEKEKTSKTWQATRRKAADLQRETSLVAQRTREVEAKTEALINVVQAEKTRQAEQISANTRKLVAEKQAEIAALDAQRAVVLGSAQADVRQLQGEADAQGFKMKVDAFGSPQSYTRYQVAQKLDPGLKIRIVHTGQGTLWTDLEKTVGTAAAGTVLKSASEAEKR